MSKGKRLNTKEIAQIEVLKKLGYSNRRVAREIKRSEGLIRNYLKNPKSYGIKKSTRGNSKLTARQKFQIKYEATKNKLYCSQIITKLSLPVVKSTVARVLKATKTIKWVKPKSKPRLTSAHMECRLKFAQKYMHWTKEWGQVIFSDEKKFNLDGPDCYSCYWHDIRNHTEVRSKRNFGGGTVMVWGGFAGDFKTPICWITTKMNADKYCELLEDVLIPFIDDHMHSEFIFQQDNASIHVSQRAKDWFQYKNIPLMEWPACSPDCNPIGIFGVYWLQRCMQMDVNFRQ